MLKKLPRCDATIVQRVVLSGKRYERDEDNHIFCYLHNSCSMLRVLRRVQFTSQRLVQQKSSVGPMVYMPIG